jgi:acyl dehydratase
MTDANRFRVEHGPVTSELLVRLATLLNDFNPAHYDLAFAREIGMPGVIGPGTLLQGWILTDLDSTLEPADTPDAAPHPVRSVDLRFRSPFLVGDTVVIDYEVDGDTVRAEASAASSGAESRVVAHATIVVSPSHRSGS